MRFRDFFSTKNIYNDKIPNFEESEYISCHYIFEGNVQDVGFRFRMYDRASKVGLVGWVKNLSDGTVEAVLQGEKNRVEHILEYMKSLPHDSIDKIEEEEFDKEKYEEFKIR